MEHQCAMFGQIMGVDANTGQEISRFDCLFVMLPMLLIENSQQQRQTGAAVESFRNEVVKGNEQLQLSISEQHLRRLNRI
jgi:hypothetical protein